MLPRSGIHADLQQALVIICNKMLWSNNVEEAREKFARSFALVEEALPRHLFGQNADQSTMRLLQLVVQILLSNVGPQQLGTAAANGLAGILPIICILLDKCVAVIAECSPTDANFKAELLKQLHQQSRGLAGERGSKQQKLTVLLTGCCRARPLEGPVEEAVGKLLTALDEAEENAQLEDPAPTRNFTRRTLELFAKVRPISYEGEAIRWPAETSLFCDD